MICGGDVLRIKLEFNPDRHLVMGMIDSCMDYFRQEDSPVEYGLKNALKTNDILTIFNIGERCWRSAMQRRQCWEQRLREEAEEREQVEQRIVEILRLYCCIPGKRVICRELIARYGIRISLKRVKKIMDGMRLVSSIPYHNPYKFEAVHDHPQTAPANRVNQNFFVAPRKVILTDITYLYYQDKSEQKQVFYLCVFKDAFTAEILGYATSEYMDVALVQEAYDLMMKLHGDELKKQPGVFLHSDQGSQYLSTTFRKILTDDNFIQSCSRRGNSQDNAPCESFFQKLKYRLKDPMFLCTSYETSSEVVKGYIRSYNSEFVQMCLGGLSPENFYRYAVTGIYPFSDYFGVLPEIVTTEEIQNKLLRQRLVNRAAAAMQRRKGIRAEIDRETLGGSGGGVAHDTEYDPVKRVLNDINLLELQKGWEQAIITGIEEVREYLPGQSEMAEEKVNFLDELLRKANLALEYMGKLLPAELQALSRPGSWEGIQWLDYARDMKGLFDYKPLHIFRNDFQKLLRKDRFYAGEYQRFSLFKVPVYIHHDQISHMDVIGIERREPPAVRTVCQFNILRLHRLGSMLSQKGGSDLIGQFPLFHGSLKRFVLKVLPVIPRNHPERHINDHNRAVKQLVQVLRQQPESVCMKEIIKEILQVHLLSPLCDAHNSCRHYYTFSMVKTQRKRVK